jgi:asparagine synthase (glutamine-hydrolysing)
MPQWLAGLDHLVNPLRLERLFLGRHKFYHFRVWYRDQLASYVREVLLDSRSLSRSYLQRAAVERTVHDHVTGRRNHTRAIHQLLTAEFTHRQLIELQ